MEVLSISVSVLQLNAIKHICILHLTSYILVSRVISMGSDHTFHSDIASESNVF